MKSIQITKQLKNIVKTFLITLLFGIILCGCRDRQTNEKFINNEDTSAEESNNHTDKETKSFTSRYQISGRETEVFQFMLDDGGTEPVTGSTVLLSDNSSYSINFEHLTDGYIAVDVIGNNGSYTLEDMAVSCDSAYLVRKNDNTFIVLSMSYDNDYKSVYLIDATSGMNYCSVINAEIQSVSDDGVFTGKFKIDLFGSYYAENTFSINNAGTGFEVLNPIYEFHNTDVTLKTKETMIVTVSEHEKHLVAGTELTPTGTDLNGTFYFMLKDGLAGYFTYEEGIEKVSDEVDVEFPVKRIDGIKEEDMFENLPYFG